MSRLLIVCGALWAALGLVLSSSAFAIAAQQGDSGRAEALALGWTLNKVCMVVLGLALAATGVAIARDRRQGRTGGGPALATIGRRELIWVGGLLVAATVLRLIALDSGLWYDEVVTLVDYVRLPAFELVTSYKSLNNHILFTLAARATTQLFGETAWALRLPSVFFGVASVAALWWLAIQVVNRREALLATALMTVSYHHVWFSQNARGYTGLLLWALIATTLFLEGMRTKARGLWLAYAVVFALAMYTHLSAVFVFAAHGLAYVVLFALCRLPGLKKRVGAGERYPGATEAWPLLGFALGGLIVLQLYAVLLPQMLDAFGDQAGQQSVNVKVSTWKNPLWTVVETLRGVQLGPLFAFAVPVGGLLGAVGFFSLLKRNPVLAILLVLHVPLTLAALITIHFHIWPRYFLVDIGFALLILVHGVFVTAGFLARRINLSGRRQADGRTLGTLAGIALVLVSLLTVPRNYRWPKQDYAGARDFVESTRGPADVVVTAGLAQLPYERYYEPRWLPVADREELDALCSTEQATWLVYSFPTYMRAIHPDILEAVESDYELVKDFPGTLGDGFVFVYRSREPCSVRGEGVKSCLGT